MIMIWLFRNFSLKLLDLFAGNQFFTLLVDAIFAMVLTFISSVLLYMFIERPFMELRNSDLIKKLITKKTKTLETNVVQVN